MPHVIKSFSRSRGSKGKERRLLERAEVEGQGGGIPRTSTPRHCARRGRQRTAGRTDGGKEEVEWGETEGGGWRGREGGNAFGEEGPTRIFITERGAPGRTGIGAAMNVGNYLSCIAAVLSFALSWKSPTRPRARGPLSRGSFGDAWVARVCCF